MLPIALSSENARSPAGASTHSGRASARARNAAPAQTGVALEAGRVHGSARIRRISTDDGLSGIARAGGLRLACPRASARRLARDSGFIAQSPSARSLRVRAGTPAHPGRTWFTHAAHMLPIALSGENARASQGLPRAQGGLQPARATSRPHRRASPRRAEDQRSYRLSPIAYRLSPIAYLSQTFQRIARITVTRHAVPIRNTICAVRSRVAFRRWRRPYIRCISVRLSF
jgi:hypothetical protein